MHGSATVRANESRRDGADRRIGVIGYRNGRRNYQQQLPYLRQVHLALGIGEQPIVADAMETTGQDMQQETAHEFVRAERHGLVTRLSLSAVILPAKGNAALVEAQ